jgi:homoserine kinase type II
LGRRFLAIFWQGAERVNRELALAARWRVALQPCIRDIWHDHVLFEGDAVSGIIDLGAMRFETVAGDVARLLGSLALDDAVAWECGIEAYKSLRPLSDIERQLIGIFDRSGTLLSGMNWLRWIYLEQRQFGNLPAIASRLNELCQRLAAMNSQRTVP